MLQLPVRVDLGAMAMKRCSAFPKAPALLEPQQWFFFFVSYQDTRPMSLTPLQRFSRCILQPRLSRPRHGLLAKTRMSRGRLDICRRVQKLTSKDKTKTLGSFWVFNSKHQGLLLACYHELSDKKEKD